MIKMIVTGRVTRELEPKYTTSGKCILNFSIASDKGFKENKKTLFINCVAFEKTAEIMGNTLSKGRKVLIMGDYDVQKWEKDGQKHSKPQCIVREFEYMDGKKDGQADKISMDDFGNEVFPEEEMTF